MNVLQRHPFRPAWWLRGRHGQSVWGPVFRGKNGLPLRRERVTTPDGDFLDLHHLETDPAKPVVLLLHGLEGSQNSFYIRGLNHALAGLGWNSLTLVFRSCGGEINRARRIYHMGETSDLAFIVERLLDARPDARLYLCGVSLGGNVLAKWLGECGRGIPANVAAAAVVSPPFQPEVGAPYFHKELWGLYSRKFLRTLIPKAMEKARQYPGVYDVEAVRRCRDFNTFDTLVTARLHGYEDAEDYWRKVGCGQFLPAIRVPTLLVAAEDDPFNPASTIPHETAARSPWLHPLFTQHGGHAGFVYGPTPFQARYWMEEQVLRFFQRYAPHAPA